MTTTTNSADVLAPLEALGMAQDLICEAKGAEGPKGGFVTDHLDAAEAWLDKVHAYLTRRTESADDALLRRLRPYVANVVEAEGALINKRDLEAIDAHLSRPRPARDEADRLAHLEAEARRFAGFYPAGSDGRNTFVIFADKIACEARALKGQKP